MNLSWLELRWLHATAIVLFVIGPYFLGAFRPQGEIGMLPFTKRVTRLGLSWAAVLPLTYVLGYWFFICHVRFSLGRWPRFGEHLSPILMLENRWAWTFGGALLGSLYIAGIALVVCACMPRWRHVTVYVFVYACAVATALGTTFLAPPSFRTWFFD
jgi:hypothetical protein